MKKLIYSLSIFSLVIFTAASVFADYQSDTTDASLAQAKQDYKIFLEQLRALNGQYKQITNEIKEVVKEEGVPIIDENTGELKMVRPGDAEWGSPSVQDQTATVFGDADIRETNKEMIVKVDLPGVDKNKIKIKIENNRLLRIDAERREETEDDNFANNSRYRRIERAHGSFQRVIELPSPAKDTGIDARYDNGVLTVRIPKAVETRKEIAVAVR